MPTQAISSYGIALRLGDGTPLAALTVTGATNATPIVITTSAAHGVTDVSKGTITGVVGTTGANGTWVVERVTATTLKLRGSIGNGAYVSGGSLVLDSTYATIAEVTNIEDAGVTATVIEVSAHDGSGWASRIPTMFNNNAVRLSLNHVPDHATQDNDTGLLFLMRTKASRPFLLVLPDTAKTAWWAAGWVTSFQETAAVGAALTSQVTVEMTDIPILSAA